MTSPSDVLASLASSQSSSETQWPAATEILYSLGSSKVKVTFQSPLLREVLQDGIENMQGCLVFNNTFPDVSVVITFASASLMTTAEDHEPEATMIHQRFREDAKYFGKLVTMVCTPMSELLPE